MKRDAARCRAPGFRGDGPFRPVVFRWGLVVAIALGFATVSDASPVDLQRPRLVVREPIFDAGSVVPGDTVHHAFELRNEGDAALSILGAQAACGCTVARYPDRLEAGAVGAIETVLSTVGLGEGPFLKTVTVRSTDPDQASVVLTLRGEVRSALRVSPGRFRWQGARSGERSPELPQVVMAESPVPGLRLEITRVESPAPWLEVSFRRASDAERPADVEPGDAVWIVVARLLEAVPAGGLSGEVVVHTNHPRQPRLVIPLSGLVRPPAPPA